MAGHGRRWTSAIADHSRRASSVRCSDRRRASSIDAVAGLAVPVMHTSPRCTGEERDYQLVQRPTPSGDRPGDLSVTPTSRKSPSSIGFRVGIGVVQL